MLESIDITGLVINSLFSVKRVLVGVLVAIVLGITIGLLRSLLPPKVKKNVVIKFLFEAPKFPPPIAWIPFVILLFGIGEISAYTIVFIGAFPPIFTSTYEGAESVPLVIKNSAQSMELSRFKYLSEIVFSASLPQILLGIRVEVGMGWMSVIAAEMICGQSGLGYSIQLNRLNMQYNLMILDVAIIGIVGFLLIEGTKFLQKIIIPWHEVTI